MHRRPPRLIGPAELFEREVELLEVLAFGNWAKHVIFDEPVGALDAALLVASCRRRELHFEREPAAESAKGFVLLAVAATQDARDRRPGVVEHADPGNAPEVHDGTQDAAEKGDLILTQRNTCEDPTAIAEAGDE